MPLPGPQLQRAVFLDRDGVLNRPIVRLGKPFPPADLASFEIYPDAVESCRLLKAEGLLLVVVTNQPDVGRGLQSKEIVEAMHRRLQEALPLDRIEACFDSDDAAASGYYKPAPGMLYRAANALGIDLRRSYMVGDRWRDVDCGRAAGCTTVFIDRGYEEPLRSPADATVREVLEAAEWILEKESGQRRPRKA
jgi:D-glycero-D-manno-heptose 1,7-bisphosphate phosphatase